MTSGSRLVTVLNVPIFFFNCIVLPVDDNGIERGMFKHLGRLSQDIIKKGGYKISALEIEGRILEHPSVLEIVVVGIHDEKQG